MPTVTPAYLRLVAHRYVTDKDLLTRSVAMNHYLPLFDIKTNNRIAMFTAQIAHETGGFRWSHELGSPSYFAKYEPGTRIGKNLGNNTIGDGARYKGRGDLQLTGRFNYTMFHNWLLTKGYSPVVNVVKDPETLLDMPFRLLSALFYWEKHKLNRHCDTVDIKGLTKAINGGYNGLTDRTRLTNRLLGHPLV